MRLFSAHQMSSARIGGDARSGAVRPDGETWDVENVFVVDGSVFPTATGVNPMLSILGTAHYLSTAYQDATLTCRLHCRCREPVGRRRRVC